MKVPTKRYQIHLKGVISGTSNGSNLTDSVFLESCIGTRETNWLLEKYGVGFNSASSVYYYQQNKKGIPVDGGMVNRHNGADLMVKEPGSYWKGFLFWCTQMGRPENDKYFNSSTLKAEAIQEGSSFYKNIYLLIE